MTELFSSEQLVDTLLIQRSSEGHSGIKDHLPFETLLGSGIVQQELLGIKFSISPTSFFQVNTGVAELMYQYVRDQCSTTSEKSLPNLLFDLCCGTGTIGQLMASAFDRVIGIDIVESAILDARNNAEANEITNVEYHAGKCESLLASIIRSEVYGIMPEPTTTDESVEKNGESVEKTDESMEKTRESMKKTESWKNPVPAVSSDTEPKYACTAILDPPRGIPNVSDFPSWCTRKSDSGSSSVRINQADYFCGV